MGYKRLGDYIQQVNVRNTALEVDTLLGVSITKKLIPSIANTIGTDMSVYKIIKRQQFAYGTVTSRNGDKISIALADEYDKALVSQIYVVFEVIDKDELLPEYLMMWFSRPEFDRYARYHSHGSTRETFDWDNMCEVQLPIPSINKQRAIVSEYQSIENKITINNQICEKLEATAQALYRHWFVDFEFPNEDGKPYKSSGGAMVYNEELEKEIPEGWEVKELVSIGQVIMGQSPDGESYNEDGKGIIFYQGRTEFGFRIPSVRKYTSNPKRYAKEGSILISVRAPVGDLNIATTECCIGRGLASVNYNYGDNSFLFYFLLYNSKMFELSDAEGTIFGSVNREELGKLKVIFNIEVIELFNIKTKIIDNDIIVRAEIVNRLTHLQSLLLSRLAKQ